MTGGRSGTSRGNRSQQSLGVGFRPTVGPGTTQVILVNLGRKLGGGLAKRGLHWSALVFIALIPHTCTYTAFCTMAMKGFIVPTGKFIHILETAHISVLVRPTLPRGGPAPHGLFSAAIPKLWGQEVIHNRARKPASPPATTASTFNSQTRDALLRKVSLSRVLSAQTVRTGPLKD